MNWEVIASTGEWAGAIAVVATLFYLAQQIRQQNRIAEYNAWNSMMSEFNAFNRTFVNNMSLHSLFLEGLSNPDQLSDADAAHFQEIFRTQFNGTLNVWKAYETGNLSERDWIAIASWFAYEVRSMPGGQKWRQLHDHILPEFWEAIDKLPIEDRYGDRSLGRGAR